MLETTAYDVIPYTSHPYAQTRPERLGTLAVLMGLTPAPLAKCRVLELGCSSGGNIVPLAEGHPGSEFVAIDASIRQVDLAQEAIQASGLANVQVLHKNILDVSADLGQFDYIICHGVFSWVPPKVQEKILAICNENLAPNGLAFVSYNALPGWHMRGVIRDMMVYRSRQFENAEDQIRHARAVVDLAASFLDRDKDAYGMWLREEARGMHDKADDYIFHDYLEENNIALYFHQFMDMAQAAGLQEV